MSLNPIGRRQLVTAPREATIAEITRQLAERNVDSTVVVSRGRPVGIVVDRDPWFPALRQGLAPESLPAEDVLTEPVMTVPADTTLEEAVHRMREACVRRLPVVDARGRVIAIVTFDDLVRLLGRTHRVPADRNETCPVLHQGG